MNNDVLKTLLNGLDREAFVRFVYELWHQDDKDDGLTIRDTYPLVDIGEDILEHNYIQRPSKNSANEYQGFDLILPYFFPLELFNNPSDVSLDHPSLKTTLIKYKRLIDPGFRKCENKKKLPKYVLSTETPINNAPPVV